MGRAKKTLRVIPNPFGMVDHNGQPCCAVMMGEPFHVPYGAHRFVGAQRVSATLVRPPTETIIGNVVHQTVAPDHDVVWEFSTDVVEVPEHPYYFEHVSRGDLIAADADTAKRCGISQFVDPRVLLAKAKDFARKEWDDQNGAGDFDAAEQERAQAAADAKAAESAPTEKAKQPTAEATKASK